MTDPSPSAIDLHALSKSELKAWAGIQPVPELPDEPASYFHLDRPGTRLVPVAELKARRDPEEDAASVHRAMVFAAAAREGRLDRREPIRVSDLEDGTLLIIDGTSTYGVALRAGWKMLPVSGLETE
jgi:hypothetical protein